jgi:O-antigen/teichoic acid export membrane protein
MNITEMFGSTGELMVKAFKRIIIMKIIFILCITGVIHYVSDAAWVWFIGGLMSVFLGAYGFWMMRFQKSFIQNASSMFDRVER